jgi:hypothetical protein
MILKNGVRTVGLAEDRFGDRLVFLEQLDLLLGLEVN